MAQGSGPAIVGDCIRLWSGEYLPLGLWRSEVERLREQALRISPQLFREAQDRKRMYDACEVAVIKQYRRRCYDCEDVIVIDYKVEPILRPLTKDDAASNGSESAWFHKDCWSLYKQFKANKRRRSSYSGLTPPQPPQPPVPLHYPHHNHVVVEDEPPPLAIEDQVKDDEAEDKPPALAIEDQVKDGETKDQPPEHAIEEQHQEAEVDG